MTVLYRIAACLALVNLFAFASPASAQFINLTQRWEPGTAADYTLNETMIQSISGGPVQSELLWKREIRFTDRVSRAIDGSVCIEREYTALKMEVTRDTEPPKRYDSTTAQQPAPDDLLITPFLGIVGAKISFSIAEDGRVYDLVGADKTIDALLGPLSGGPLADGLDAFAKTPDRNAQFARQLEQAMRLIPGRSVPMGTSWPVKIDHTSPIAGGLSSNITATLESMDRSRRLPVIKLEGTLSQGSAENEPGSLVGLLGITLDAGKITGRMLFDEELGQPVSSEIDLATSWTIGAALLGDGDPIQQSIRQTSVLKRDPE